MISKRVKMAIFVGVALISSPCFAQTLCKTGEVNIYSGRVGRQDPTTLVVTGSKIVSLCADSAKNTKNLVYRFGSEGKIEMEFKSPLDGKFFLDKTSDPHTTTMAATFKRGNISYSLTHCEGMCNGYTALIVFSGSKKIATLTADTETQSGEIMSGMDMSDLSPAVLQRQRSGLNVFR